MLTRSAIAALILLLGSCVVGDPNAERPGPIGDTDPDPDPDPDPTPAGADAGPQGVAQSLSVTFSTQPVGGSIYAPANVVATWIEDAQGNFIATIDRKSGARTRHLVAWQAMAGQDQDAVSGASRLDHNTPVSITWDIPADLPDGVYTIRMEVADDNSTTPDQNNQGTFTFNKNGQASLQEGLAADGFTNVSIDYSGSL